MQRNKLFSIIMIAALLPGCKKFVDVALPTNQLSTEASFATDSKANSAMRGIYATFTYVLVTGPFTGALTGNLGLSADELEKTTLSGDQQFYFENNVAPDNSTNYGLWGAFYTTIYQANNAYVNLEQSKGLSPLSRDQMMGESRFLRAWSYFYLVNLFDSVPLALTPDYRVNALLPRVSSSTIYDQIRQDLAYAQEKAGDANLTIGARGRANRWSATALLAKVNLYTKNWAEAEKQATAVITSGYFKMDPPDSVFLATSRETIMNVANAGANLYAGEGTQINGAGTNPNYRFTTYLNNAFETGDLRLDKWTRVGANGFRGPAKFKVFSNTTAGAKKEALPVFRLAEQYLIRAEARARQSNLSGAIADIDSVRKRAALPLISTVNPNIGQSALIDAIMKERMTELFAELGQRWFDVKRTGAADAVFGARKPKWRPDAIIFPVPLAELQYNPNL